MSFYTEARGTAKRIAKVLSKEIPMYPKKSLRRPEFGPDTQIEFADDFHDLMHSIWDRDCGNRRLHLRHWWDFKGEPGLIRAIFCPWGFHDWGWVFQYRPEEREFVACRHCWQELGRQPKL